MSAPRFILLTGVTRGLGRALFDRFDEAGHTVAGCGRSSPIISELSRTASQRHSFEAVDTADDVAVRDWAKRVLAIHGPPDLLLNNAAVINRSAPLHEISATEFDELFRVNVSGVANVLRHFLPAMIARKSGVIANLSSGWGRSTSPEVAPYCASKWAIEGLSQALAQELPTGMACVAVNPGIINTDMLRSCFAEGAANYPDADTWSRTAAAWYLRLGPSDNGCSRTVGDRK
jgi:NAD(P)-dependent dehydrogenase (short-subunit alcohol dehydrogenase family)